MALPITPTLPPAAPAPSGAPAPADTGAPDSGFAEMLKGQTARPAATDTKRPGRETAPDEALPAETAVTAETPVADATDALADPAPADDARIDPSIAQWLASLHMPPPAEPRPPVSTAASAGSDEGDAGDAPIAGLGARGPARAGTAAAGERPGTELRAARDTGKALPTTTAAVGDEPKQAAATATSTTPTPKTTGFELPALAAPATPAPAAAVAAPAAPVDLSLPMAPDASGFGEAFATQVSVLARDGVQQAELHLNPAETGPVSIQIVLDGTQARIDFGADALPTRQAIEQSLPELAAALREQGLTLSGGGVSEHSRGRTPQPFEAGEPGSARRRGDPADAAPAVRSVRIARSAGGLDLYA